MSAQPGTALERLGGPAALRAIVDEFVDRVMQDVMIGFHFRRVDRGRLKTLEYEFAAQHLSGHGHYTGRPLRAVHAAHRILGGQFNRRLVILRQVLERHGAPEDVIGEWLTYNESLRAHITADDMTECND